MLIKTKQSFPFVISQSLLFDFSVQKMSEEKAYPLDLVLVSIHTTPSLDLTSDQRLWGFSSFQFCIQCFWRLNPCFIIRLCEAQRGAAGKRWKCTPGFFLGGCLVPLWCLRCASAAKWIQRNRLAVIQCQDPSQSASKNRREVVVGWGLIWWVEVQCFWVKFGIGVLPLKGGARGLLGVPEGQRPIWNNSDNHWLNRPKL